MAASCASGAARAEPQPPVPANCPETVARARAEGSTIGGPAVEPAVDLIFIPPPAPRELRGTEVLLRFRVDEQGRVELPSIVVEGSADERFNQELARTVARYRFAPARLQGCPVPADVALRILL